MNMWLFGCHDVSTVSMIFPFLWGSAYKLIPDEMYVVCSAFDMSSVTSVNVCNTK
jgi:hypothetical protein